MKYRVLKVGGLGLAWPHYEVWCETTGEVWDGRMTDLPDHVQAIVAAAERLRRPSEYEGIPGERVLDMDIGGEDPHGKRVALEVAG